MDHHSLLQAVITNTLQAVLSMKNLKPLSRKNGLPHSQATDSNRFLNRTGLVTHGFHRYHKQTTLTFQENLLILSTAQPEVNSRVALYSQKFLHLPTLT